MGRNWYREPSTSMNTEDTPMANRDFTSSLPPSSFQPSRNRGMFSRKTTAPMGAQGSTALTICPTPVMPPKAIPLGA